MKLTAYTNYALRMLMYAALNNNEMSSIGDVSKAYGISANHLKKAAAEMAEHGYLMPHQGRYGGYVLAKSPQDIVIGDVVRITEGDMDMVECFNPETNTCPLIEVCKLPRLFKKALRAFLEVLDEVTLADIIARPKELKALLGI